MVDINLAASIQPPDIFYAGDSYSNDTLIRGYRRDDTDYSQTYAIGFRIPL